MRKFARVSVIAAVGVVLGFSAMSEAATINLVKKNPDILSEAYVDYTASSGLLSIWGWSTRLQTDAGFTNFASPYDEITYTLTAKVVAAVSPAVNPTLENVSFSVSGRTSVGGPLVEYMHSTKATNFGYSSNLMEFVLVNGGSSTPFSSGIQSFGVIVNLNDPFSGFGQNIDGIYANIDSFAGPSGAPSAVPLPAAATASVLPGSMMLLRRRRQA